MDELVDLRGVELPLEVEELSDELERDGENVGITHAQHVQLVSALLIPERVDGCVATQEV